MACGVHLGIFLICLVQAEHVRCSWATQVRGQNSNTYAGFSQQDSGLRRLGGSYLQNQFRQASAAPGSAQSSSLNTGTGYRQGLSSSGYSPSVSQPAHSGYTSAKLAQSSLFSEPNWRTTSLNQLNAQKVPANQFVSTPIVSGGSVSKYSTEKQHNPIGKSRTRPVNQGRPYTSQYPSSSSASALGPRESYSFKPVSQQSAAQKASMLNQRPAPRGFASKSSLFSPRSPATQLKSGNTPTSARAPARRVSGRPSKKSQLSSGFSYSQSNMASAGVQQSFRAPKSNAAGPNDKRFAPTEVHNIPNRFGGFAIRRLKEPDQKEASAKKLQTVSARPQQAYSARPQQAYSARPQQGYSARLQQAYTAPSQRLASYKPPAPSVHQESKWKRVKLTGQLTGVAGVVG